MSESSYLIYSVRGRRRIVRVADVHEITPLMALDVIDESRGAFRGMLDLRGDVVPVFDLAGEDVPLHPSRLVLIARRRDVTIGLIVDEVHEVISVDDALVVQRPIGQGRTIVAVRVGSELLTLLDPRDAEIGSMIDAA